MASSKLLNLSAAFLCSSRTSSSRRIFALYTFSPRTKSQYCPRFSTSAATTTALGSASSVLSNQEVAPLAPGHPWPEWGSFLEKLRSKGYFERATTTATEVKGEGEAVTVVVEDATMETNQVKNACLKFGRDRFDILSSLPKKDLRAVVESGCPNLFRKAVNSSKRLRAFLHIDEGDACGICKLRGSCDKAYVDPKDEEEARTVDVIRVLLTHALELNNLSGGEHFVQTNVQESARSLLAELIRLSDTMIDPSLPKPIFDKVSTKKGKLKDPAPKAYSKSHQSVGVEMKKGDWLCPKCNFLNFARNMRCLECKEDGPRMADLSEIETKTKDWICPKCSVLNFGRNVQCIKCNEDGPKVLGSREIEMKAGDWICPKCQYMNFSRNKACFRCDEPCRRELNFGEWQCPSCNYVNFNRNRECRKCNCERPKETGGDQYDDRVWQRPKKTFRESNFKFGDEEGEDGGMSNFEGYLGQRRRGEMAERR